VYYFNRLFERQTGFTVRAFVTEQRLIGARRLLNEGKLNVSGVACSVGYDVPYHFSRRFSPSVSRKDQRMI
jgi:transcriptional regulator GlxA family with amidase domain